MGNDMYNDEQLAHAEIVQKETEEALGYWKERALKAEAERDALLSHPAPPADALHATPESDLACAVCDADVCEHIAARLAPPADAATEAVREAAEALVRQIDVVDDSPEYMAVWGVFWTRGMKYRGPRYEAELLALKRALWPEMARLYPAPASSTPAPAPSAKEGRG